MPAPDIADLIRRAEALERRLEAPRGPFAGGGRARTHRVLEDAAVLRRRIRELEAKRKRDLAAIHAQAKQAGIDEHTRRLMVQRLSAGRTLSSADLTEPERAKLLAELGGGQRPAAARGKPSAEAMDHHTMLKRVEGLLADQELPWSYAEAILRRQRGIKTLTPPGPPLPMGEGGEQTRRPAGALAQVACPLAQATEQELRGVIAALYRRQHKGAPHRTPKAST